MNSVTKQPGPSAVHPTSTPSQIEEQKPAETKSEPEQSGHVNELVLFQPDGTFVAKKI